MEWCIKNNILSKRIFELFFKKIRSFSEAFYFLPIVFILFLPNFVVAQMEYPKIATSRGKDFWFAFMPNRDLQSDNKPQVSIYVHTQREISKEINAVVEIPRQNYRQSFSVKPGGATQLTLPLDKVFPENITSSTEVLPVGIHLIAEDTVSVIAMNSLRFSSEATTIYPKTGLDNEYKILTYLEEDMPSQFMVVSSANNTQVTITPSASTTHKKPANQPFDITLNAGDAYLVQSYEDLTGSIVKGLGNGCSNISVFSGSVWTKIGNCDNGNHLFEQNLPLSLWGKQYVGMPFQTRSKYKIKIIAQKAGTEVKISSELNPIELVKLSESKSFTKDYDHPIYISADFPIQVAQFNLGAGCENTLYGDPGMVMLQPVEKMKSKLIHTYLVENASIPQTYLSIASTQKNPEKIFLDNIPLDPSAEPQWIGYLDNNPINAPIYLHWALAKPGLHTLTSDSSLMALAYGFGEIDGWLLMSEPVLWHDLSRILGPETLCKGTIATFKVEDYGLSSDLLWMTSEGRSGIGPDFSTFFEKDGIQEIMLRVRKNKDCSSYEINLSKKIFIQNITLQIERIQNETCTGKKDGFVKLGFSNGTSPFQYRMNEKEWSDQMEYSNLTPGSYIFEAKDFSGCISEPVLIDIREGSQFKIDSVIIQPIICFGQTAKIELKTSGGTGPYVLILNDVLQTKAITEVEGLQPGTYSIKLRDSNGCEYLIPPIQITGPSPLTSIVKKKLDALCATKQDGEIKIHISGGVPPYVVDWDGKVDTLSDSFFSLKNIGGGVHTFRIQDQNNCEIFQNFNFKIPKEIKINLIDKKNVRCKGYNEGRIIVKAEGGIPPYEYSLNGGNFTGESDFMDLTAGNYIISTRDSAGCTVTHEPILIESITTGLSLQIISIIDETCQLANDGIITVKASGGQPPYLYAIDNQEFGSRNIFNSLGRTVTQPYQLRVKDQIGCEADTFLKIGGRSEITVKNFNLINNACASQNMGLIQFIITSKIFPLKIKIISESYEKDTTYDNNENGKKVIFSDLKPGKYQITITDAMGCKWDTTIISEAPIPFESKLLETKEVKCFDSIEGSFKLQLISGTSPFTVKISETGDKIKSNERIITFTGLKKGKYSIIVTDSLGCETTIRVIITGPERLIARIEAIKKPTCGIGNDAAAKVWIIGGVPPVKIYWNGNNPSGEINSGLSSGKNLVTVIDANGCTFETEFFIENAGRISLPENFIFCRPRDKFIPDPISFGKGKPEGGFWTGENILPNGQFKLRYDIMNYKFWAYYHWQNCIDSMLIVVTSVKIEKQSDFVCPKQNTYLLPNAFPEGGTWTGRGLRSDKEINLESWIRSEETYYYRSPAGCVDSFVLTLRDDVNYNVEFYPKKIDTLSYEEAVVTFRASAALGDSLGMRYRWYLDEDEDPKSTESFWKVIFNEPGEHTIRFIVLDPNDCRDEKTLKLFIRDPISLHIPNAFSPNGDGNNDEWNVILNGVLNYQCNIFNRWGEKVYSTNSPILIWDGKCNGMPAPEGSYIYNMEVTNVRGDTVQYRGSLMIIR